MTDEIRKRLDEYGAAERDRGAGDGRWILRRDAARAALEAVIEAEVKGLEQERDHYRGAGELLVGAEEDRQTAESRVRALEGALTDALRALREPRMWETRVHVAQGILNAALATGKERL